MLILLVFNAQDADAQMFSGRFLIDDENTAREEAQGKVVWEALRDKKINCDQLTGEQYSYLGEFFMGQMMGTAHAAMNTMMIRMMGEQGEDQVHVVMGQRLSGCNINAVLPVQTLGFMPMMNMMWGGWTGAYSPIGWESWGMMVLIWVLIILVIAVLIRWLLGQARGSGTGRSPLEILQQRYARGDISKKEFEEKKKDLTK